MRGQGAIKSCRDPPPSGNNAHGLTASISSPQQAHLADTLTDGTGEEHVKG